MLAVDVDMAAQHSPPALCELWAQTCEQHDVEPLVGPHDPTVPAGASAGRTATIYQFGQGRDGRFVWYVFRSYADFEAERWDQGGFGVKPHPDGGFEPDAVAPETIDEMVDMSIRIRTEQDAHPPHDRIYIGGELWLTSLSPGAFTQIRIHRFDDWSDHWNSMNGYHDLSSRVP